MATVVPFKVVMDDGTEYEGKLGLSAFVAIERKFNIAAGSLQHDPRIEYTLYGAYFALSKNGSAGSLPDYETFLDKVSEFTVGGLPEAEDSTENQPPTN